MLLLGSSYKKIPLLSLRVGAVVGSVVGHVINPHNLTIEALWVRVGGYQTPQLLLPQDIRETSPRGIIINDTDVVIDQSDAVKLQKILEMNFELIHKKVISGRLPIGKVGDYAIDADSYVIQKLYVDPNILRQLRSDRLTIARSQVVEVSHTYVKVKSSEIRESSPGRQTSSASLPFPVASSSFTRE